MSTTLPRWQVSFPAEHVIIAEVVAAAAVLALATKVWWLAVIAVLPIAIVVGVRYRGDTALRWLTRAAIRRTVRVPIPGAVSVELPGVGPIGIRYDGQYAITVIALHGRPFPTTTLVPAGAETADTIPLQAIGALLRQFGGLQLHSIDVVSAGARVAPDGRYTPLYDEIIGDLPAVGGRRTWLILRLCPQACLNALAYRGNVGVAVAAATERIRQAAVRAGCRATTCGADQLDAATTALLGRRAITDFQEHWTHLRVGNDYVSSYRIAGVDLTNRVLGDVWAIRRSKMTVTVLRLTHDPDSGIAVSALVRLHTAAPLTHPPRSTLQSVPGQQRAALCASLPLGNRALELELSGRPLPSGDLVVPVGPCGPILGRIDGVPLLMPFTDPLKYVKIAIDVEVPILASLLLRAIAAGATAVVYTTRTGLWEPICDERLTVRDERRILAGDPEPEPTPTPTLVVADCGMAARRLMASGGERGHALVITGVAPPECDVVITQVAESELLVQVGSRTLSVAVWPPRNEDQFLRSAFKT